MIALRTIQRDVTAPPVATRILALQSLAVYDTLAAIEGTPAFLVQQSVSGPIAADAAASMAAYRVLYLLYPTQRVELDAALATSLASIADGAAKSAGLQLGQNIADAVVAIRARDGYLNYANDDGGPQAGQWRPTGPAYLTAQEPQWGQVVPFALNSASQFRPTAPAALDSAEYAAALNEVKTLGSANSATRTPDQTQQALFWADGGGSVTPPGHWNQIAADVAKAKGNSLAANARLFAQLNVALADAAIAAWDAKYSYDFWRPVTAIQQADLDNNPATAKEANWTPFLITPAHPSYVSGHSTFSAAAAEVLTAAFGEQVAFSTTSSTLPNVVRSFTSFKQAAEEAGASRIYGGIHFSLDNVAGKQIGTRVAATVLERFRLSADTQAPALMLADSAAASAVNPVFSGQILDNLSGVASAQYRIDDGPLQNLPLQANGNFSIRTDFALDGSRDGAHSLTIIAQDAAGNQSPLMQRSFILDTKAPILSLSSIQDGDVLNANSVLSGVADPSGGALQELRYRFDDGAWRSMIFDGRNNFAQTLDWRNLSPGSHTLSISALDSAGNRATLSRLVQVNALAPLTITELSPAHGSTDVGSTFHPKINFSRAVDTASLNGDSFYATGPDGRKLGANIVTASDGSYAWLFLHEAMPGGSVVNLHVRGDLIRAAADGALLDADGNGAPGGLRSISFTTVSLSPVLGTKLIGRVVDPGADLKPGTFDDIRRGPDGVIHTADDVFLNPIAHARVSILGLENLVAYTDANGYFELNNVPVGTVKLVVDGRTSSNAPEGVFWPEMVMDIELAPGITNTVMGSMGARESRAANFERSEVYLPRVLTSALQQTSATQPSVITAQAAGNIGLTDEQRSQLTLTVQPGSALDENGRQIAAPQIGVATVPPELVKDMLPPGVMQHTFDITIQAPGVTAFAQPVQITFPNVFHAAPGTKLNVLSFDHTTGRLVINGTATVSADGKTVVSDEGAGVTAPGWHGLVPPGSPSSGGQTTPPPQNCPDESYANLKATKAGINVGMDIAGASLSAAEVIGKKLNPIISIATAANDAINFYNTLRDPDATTSEKLLSGVTAALSLVSFIPQVKLATVAIQGLWSITTSLFMDGRDLNRAINESEAARAACSANHPILSLAGRDRTEVDHRISNFRDELNLQSGYINEYIELVRRIENVTNGNYSADKINSLSVSDVKTMAEAMARLHVLHENIKNAKNIATLSFDVLASLSDYFAYTSQLIKSMDSNQVPVSGNQKLFGMLTSQNGSIERFSYLQGNGISWQLAPDMIYSLSVLDPETGSVGLTTFRSSPTGVPTIIPQIFLAHQTDDSDNDGLSDMAEQIIGSKQDQVDTDNDGISDYREIKQGTDPIDNLPVATGIVSSLPLNGNATAITLSGSNNATTKLAYIANGNAGLAIADVTQFSKPTLISKLSLGGFASDVAVDDKAGVAAVSTGNNGLSLVDVKNALAPQIIRTIPGNFTQVEIFDGILYASKDASLFSYDVLTGENLGQFSTGNSAIRSLAREGSHLYATTEQGTLIAMEMRAGEIIKRGALSNLPTGGKLFVGGKIAYIGSTTGFGGGFATVDVSNPANPVLLSGIDANNVQGGAIAANGSGLAVSVGSLLGNALDVMDVSDPTDTGKFITRYNLPAAPMDVAIGGGIAYVADGSGGLQIVNYRPFDNKGLPPTVEVDSSAIDQDPNQAGLQVVEGSSISLSALIRDDVQVGNVELLVNGKAVSNDISFPFDLRAALPSIAANGGSTVSLAVRATDTGGNVSSSSPIIVELIRDTTPPVLQSANVTEGMKVGASFRNLRLNFSEPLDQSKFNTGAITVLDERGQAVPPQNIQFRLDGRQVQLSFAQFAIGHYTVHFDAEKISDTAGNPIASAPADLHFTVQRYTNEWLNSAGGDWSNAANWSAGRLPTESDDVGINLDPGAILSISNGKAQVGNLDLQGELHLLNGEFSIAGAAIIQGTYKQSGGVLSGTGSLQLNGTDNLWTGGRMTGGGVTRIAQNATLQIGGDSAYLAYWGDRTLENAGTIITQRSYYGHPVDFEGRAVLDMQGGSLSFAQDGIGWSDYYNGSGNTDSLEIKGQGQIVAGALNLSNTSLKLADGLQINGAVLVSGSGEISAQGNISVSTLALGGGQTNLDAPLTFNGKLKLDGGNLTASSQIDVNGDFIFNNGQLDGAGVLRLHGANNQWTGGRMTGGGVTRIGQNATLQIGGNNASLAYWGDRTLENAGTIVTQRGYYGHPVDLDGQAVLEMQGGSLSFAEDVIGWFDYYNGSGDTDSLEIKGQGQITNGTLYLYNTSLKLADGLQLSGAVLVNGSGNIAAQGNVTVGALTLAGGQASWDAPLTFNGKLKLDGVNLTASSQIDVIGDFILSNGQLDGAGALRLYGSGNQWTGGRMSGGGTTQIGKDATLTIGGNPNTNSLAFWADRTLLNAGSIITKRGYTGNPLDFDGKAMLDMQGGTLSFAEDGIGWFDYHNGSGNTDSLEIKGQGNIEAGSLSLTNTSLILHDGLQLGGALQFYGSGNIAAQGNISVSSLSLGSGQANWNSPVNFNGNLKLAGANLTISDQLEVTGNFSFTEGQIAGSGTLRLNGANNQWSGGWMSGGGTTSISKGATLTIGGNNSIAFLADRTLLNAGTILTQRGYYGNPLDIEGKAVLDMQDGSLSFAEDGIGWFDYNNGSGNLDSLEIKGRGNISAGTLTLTNTSLILDDGLQLGGALQFYGSGNIAAQGQITLGSLGIGGGQSVWNAPLSITGDLKVNGGTVSASNQVDVNGNFMLSSGKWDGAGTLTLNGFNSQWIGGEMTGGGTTRLSTDAKLTIGGEGNIPSYAQWGDRKLVNAGEIVSKRSNYGAALDLEGKAVLDLQGGSLRFTTDFGWMDYGNNSGNTDSLLIQGEGSILEGKFSLSNSTITFADGLDMHGNGALDVTGNVVLEGAASLENLTLSGGTATVNGNLIVKNALKADAGILGGNGTVTLEGNGSTWTGALMTGGGTTRIASGATLTIGDEGNSYSYAQWGNRTLENAGAIVSKRSNYGASLDIEGNAVLSLQGGTLSFTTDFGWMDYGNNSGNTDSLLIQGKGSILEGKLSVSNSTIKLADGLNMHGNGALGVTGNAVLEGSASVENLTLAGGTITVGGNLTVKNALKAEAGILDGNGTVTLEGSSSTWTGALMTGGGTTRIANGATLTIGNEVSSYSYAQWGNRTLVNAGAIASKRSNYGAALDLEGNAILDLQGGSLRFTTDFGWMDYGNNSGNADSLRIQGEGSILEGTLSVSNSTITLADGLKIQGNGALGVTGNAVLEGAASLDNLTLSGGMATVRGNLTVKNALKAESGILDGSGMVTLEGSGNTWTGGLMTGGGTTRIASSATLTLGSDTNIYSYGQWGDRTLVNAGAIISKRSYYGAPIDLEGKAVLDLQGGSLRFTSTLGWVDYNNSSGAADSLQIKGQGQILEGALNLTHTQLVLDDGVSLSGNINLDGNSTLKAQGTVQIGALGISGAAITVDNPMTLNGNLNIEGQFTINSSATIMGNLNFRSGRIDGAGTLTLQGQNNTWTGGTMSGGGITEIASGATLNLTSNYSNPNLEQRTINNHGNFVHSMPSPFYLTGNSVLNNYGVMDLQVDSTWMRSPWYANGDLVLNNTGLLKKSAGTGSFYFYNTTLNNTGRVQAASGAIVVNGVTIPNTLA
ncbi:Ig-like domain-containing protein [Massilia sp. W12]|uniref:Ig-like domain-containing protein n=1 Tax=Massilia sp. W12 TaxID=3126507 RepID=UPI0030D1EFAA